VHSKVCFADRTRYGEFKVLRRTWTFRMTKMNVWWWLSVPYSVILPLFVLVFRLKDSIPHTLGLFIYLAFLTTFSSGVWMLVTIFQLTASRNTTSLTWSTKVKLGFVLLSVLFWVLSWEALA
jgi:hypothetical protein